MEPAPRKCVGYLASRWGTNGPTWMSQTPDLPDLGLGRNGFGMLGGLDGHTQGPFHPASIPFEEVIASGKVCFSYNLSSLWAVWFI